MINIEDKEIIKCMKKDYATFLEKYDEEVRRKSTNELLNDSESLKMFMRTEPDFNFVQDIMKFLKKYHLGKRVQLSGICYYEHLLQNVSLKTPKYDQIDLTIPFDNSFTSLGKECIDDLVSGRHPARWIIDDSVIDMTSNKENYYEEEIFNISPRGKNSKLILGAHPIELTFTTKERYWEED